MRIRTLITVTGAMLLTACSSIPEPLQGTYSELTPKATSARDIGTNVRWGGVILDARPDANRTCFEVLSRELDRSMRPEDEDLTQGRFIACRNGFLDPEVFAKGREITLTGEVQALDQRKVGDFDYTYPVLAARFMTMWPERPDVIINNFNDPFYDPFIWGPYWGPYYRPWGFYGRPGFGAYPRTTVRTGGSNDRVDVPENLD